MKEGDERLKTCAWTLLDAETASVILDNHVHIILKQTLIIISNRFIYSIRFSL